MVPSCQKRCKHHEHMHNSYVKHGGGENTKNAPWKFWGPMMKYRVQAHLKSLVQFSGHSVEVSGSLYDVNGPASEPWSMEFGEERLLGDKRADAGRKAEHFVEANRHGVDGRVR